MAISNYSELVTAVSNWLARSDLSARIPEFIALAEARFYNGDTPLRIVAMQGRDSGTSVSAAIALQSDYLETIRLSAVVGGRGYSLSYISPHGFAEYEYESGYPSVYTILNGELKLAPTNDVSYVHDYYKRLTAISDSNPTNWIITNAPNLYLYGTLLEAAPYIKDDKRIQQWSALYQSALNGLNNAESSKYGASNMSVVAA